VLHPTFIHDGYKQYFMALRLLALSGDKNAKDQIIFHSWPVRHFLSSLTPRVPLEQRGMHLVGHPLWGAYSQERDSLTAQWEAMLHYPRYKNDLDPKLLKSFMEYTSIVDPKTANANKVNYNILLLELYAKGEDTNSILTTLQSLDTSDLKALVSNVRNQINAGRHLLALSILEEAYQRLESDAERLTIGFNMATCIRRTQDATRFIEAEDYLQGVLQSKPEDFKEDQDTVKQMKYQALRLLFDIYTKKGDEKGIVNVLKSLDISLLEKLLGLPDYTPLCQVEYYIITHPSLAMPILKEAHERSEIKFSKLNKDIRIFYAQSRLKLLDEKGDKENLLKELQLDASDLEKNVVLTIQNFIIEDAEKNKWNYRIFRENGHLDPVVFKEMIDLYESLTGASLYTSEKPGDEKSKEEKPENEKKKGED
jgi:hypothetical protein